MPTILFFILLSFSIFSRENRKIYIGFGCCFQNEPVQIYRNKKLVFDKIVNTESSTGTDINNFVFFTEPNINLNIRVRTAKKNKEIFIKPKKIFKDNYVQINYYKDSLYYVSDSKPILSY